MAAYANKLKSIIDNPNGYGSTAGFQFGLDNALGATERSNSRMRGSGNALAALMQTGVGYANQERGAEIDRLGRLEGQDMQNNLGMESNRLSGIRDANAMTLGTEQNRLTGQRNANDFTLGQGQLTLGNRNADNTRLANDQQFGLGMHKADNDFTLGQGQLDSTNQRNWWDYSLGQDRQRLAEADSMNRYNLDLGRQEIDWFGANTQRGQAQSSDYWRGDDSRRAWETMRPKHVIGYGGSNAGPAAPNPWDIEDQNYRRMR